MFKRVALPMAAAAVLMSVGAAGAADLDLPVLRGSEVIAPDHRGDHWSGVYLGGHVGAQFVHNRGAHSNSTGQTRDNGQGRQVWDFEYDYMNARVNYGVHLGLQRLFGNVLLGAELTFDGPMSKVDSPWYNGNPVFTTGNVGGNTYQRRLGMNWQGAAVVRAGYVYHKTLFYALGGVAFANITSCTILDNCNNFVGHIVKYTQTRLGWVVGVGMEHRLTHNWSVRAEYRYANYGSRTCLANDPCGINGGPLNDRNASDMFNRVDTHTMRVGVSYLFGAPDLPLPPVVARY